MWSTLCFEELLPLAMLVHSSIDLAIASCFKKSVSICIDFRCQSLSFGLVDEHKDPAEEKHCESHLHLHLRLKDIEKNIKRAYIYLYSQPKFHIVHDRCFERSF